MGNKVSRRSFIGGAAASVMRANVAGSEGPGTMPTRVLGRTGVRVPILGIGCGMSLWAALEKDEERGLEALRLALGLGITYMDTGQTYGDGLAETWIGKALAQRRREGFIATKILVRKADEALRETEKSLKRLQTDQIDLIHIHSLAGEDDLAQIEAKGGLLEALYRLRGQKVTRFIGVSCHHDPVVLKTALERHDFDCTQIALNPANQGWGEKGPAWPRHSFESIALPAARKKNIGVIAMKITGRDHLLGQPPGKTDIRSLVRYVLSLPISVAVVGMGHPEHIRENAELARNFQPMPKPMMEGLSRRMTAANKAALDRMLLHHRDA